MTRSHAGAAALTLLLASGASPQQLVGPGGAGAQPQVGKGVLQGAATAPAARGINPFAGPAVLPTLPPGVRRLPRPGAPPVVVPQQPAPGVPNNPAVFNPGVPPPFPIFVPPPPVVTGVTYNPVFVSRRGVASAYYVPPTAARSPGDDPYLPAEAETGPGLFAPSGEYRFLPWVW